MYPAQASSRRVGDDAVDPPPNKGGLNRYSTAVFRAPFATVDDSAQDPHGRIRSLGRVSNLVYPCTARITSVHAISSTVVYVEMSAVVFILEDFGPRGVQPMGSSDAHHRSTVEPMSAVEISIQGHRRKGPHGKLKMAQRKVHSFLVGMDTVGHATLDIAAVRKGHLDVVHLVSQHARRTVACRQHPLLRNELGSAEPDCVAVMPPPGSNKRILSKLRPYFLGWLYLHGRGAGRHCNDGRSAPTKMPWHDAVWEGRASVADRATRGQH
mmetsp:Transcript_6104/g.15602  ORF Transcript_6104/g.15602 Transcript_6104/m.15602 type:complete len:268 (-) Transcript_6104:34-837(-)